MMKRKIVSFNIVILMILISGCNQKTAKHRNQVEIESLNYTDVPASIEIKSTPTFVITSTTISESAFDIVQKVEVEQLISDFSLNKDGVCAFPCFLNFIPGETTIDEMLEYFDKNDIQVNSFPSNNNGEEDILVYIPKIEKYHNLIGFGFVVEENKLDYLFVKGENISDTKEAQDFWENYTPKQIFEEYGKPTRILLRAPGVTGMGDTGFTGYDLWIMYDALGFSIRYEGRVEDLPIYHICPEVNGNFVNRIIIHIKSQNNPHSLDSYDAILSDLDGYWSGTVLSIDEATDLTIEKFHELFITSEQPICFDSPHSIWPKR